MSGKKTPADPQRQAQLIAELRRDHDLRQKSYRDQALKLFPHVCARCSREFSGKRLRELTVHHKDHDHRINPPDGSNWELLCLYCHDNEHEKYKMAGHGDGSASDGASTSPSIFKPFEGLDALLKSKSDTPKPERE
jgi:hypothetical protein